MDDENKKRPGVLDNLAFAMLDGKPLISRLARLFIAQEEQHKRSLGRRARDAYEANEKHVGAWMRPVYTPGYGKVRETVALVVTEIARQKAIRDERQKARNFAVTYAKTLTKDGYRRSVANKLYAFEEKEWDRKDYEAKQPSCVHLSIHGDYVIGIDNRGGYGSTLFLYTLSRRTGRATLGRLKASNIGFDSKDFTTLLYRLAPLDIRAAAFNGTPVKVDFDRLAFLVGEGPTIIPFDFEGEVAITQNFQPPRLRLN